MSVPSSTRPRTPATASRATQRGIAAVRIGIVGGVTGILCCVGPTVLALLGVISAGTAYTWAYTLYDGYAWWFRLGGLVLMVALVWLALRRRNQCSLTGARNAGRKIALAGGVAVGTYALLYTVTTWLGNTGT